MASSNYNISMPNRFELMISIKENHIKGVEIRIRGQKKSSIEVTSKSTIVIGLMRMKYNNFFFAWNVTTSLNIFFQYLSDLYDLFAIRKISTGSLTCNKNYKNTINIDMLDATKTFFVIFLTQYYEISIHIQKMPK